jgi:uncharacterized membrane protein
MQGKATIAKHPLHPILVTLPTGFFSGALICDIIRALNGDPFWSHMSVALIAFGLAGGLVAAFFGFIDYFTAPMPARAKAIATSHMILNLIVIALFAMALLLRYGNNASAIGIIVTALGVIVLAFSGYLGGHLAYHYGVGADENAREEGEALGRERGGRLVGS